MVYKRSLKGGIWLDNWLGDGRLLDAALCQLSEQEKHQKCPITYWIMDGTWIDLKLWFLRILLKKFVQCMPGKKRICRTALVGTKPPQAHSQQSLPIGLRITETRIQVGIGLLSGD